MVFPESTGTMISILAANPKIVAVFYAVNNCGIFCSIDLCILWKILGVMTIYNGQRNIFHNSLGL
ncbi:MAG: hypothetical protein ACJ72Q_04340 [Nitrososphaeraceae archaeon]